MDFANLTTPQVLSVYSGKDGKCCCGCAGKHSYNSLHMARASQLRGYDVAPNEVNDLMVSRVVNLFRKNADKVGVAETYAELTLGDRLYLVYMLPS